MCPCTLEYHHHCYSTWARPLSWWSSSKVSLFSYNHWCPITIFSTANICRRTLVTNCPFLLIFLNPCRGSPSISFCSRWGSGWRMMKTSNLLMMFVIKETMMMYILSPMVMTFPCHIFWLVRTIRGGISMENPGWYLSRWRESPDWFLWPLTTTTPIILYHPLLSAPHIFVKVIKRRERQRHNHFAMISPDNWFDFNELNLNSCW